jgi:hypothetical protein
MGANPSMSSADALHAYPRQMSPDPIVVATRGDGLGARLHAILNAWALARALGLKFRLVWPRGGGRELCDPRELFSATFVERFEIQEPALVGRRPRPEVASLSPQEARSLCRSEVGRSAIEVTDCFEICAFAGESAERAQARFRAGLDQIGWSRALQDLIDQVLGERALGDELATGYSAVHIRAGDIVTGEWRQFLPVGKYMPMAYAELAISKWSGAGPVVAVSDNLDYLHHLRTHFKSLLMPGDILPGYGALSNRQRAFGDMLLLARADRILGPPRSAFTRLGANLGRLKVLGPDDLMSAREARDCLLKSIAAAAPEIERSALGSALLARDICWGLDMFSDELSLADQIALADRAVQLELSFCGALNRLAAALALVGHRRAAAKAAGRARRTAAKVDRHADPLFESLAMSIAAEVLALVTYGRGTPRLPGLPAPVRQLGKDAIRAAILAGLRRRLERCEKLMPYQIRKPECLLNLRYQIAASAWLTAAEDPVRAMARAALEPQEGELPFLSAWRSSGLDNLRSSSGSFSQVSRNLEAVSIRLARAIGAALAASPVQPRPGARCHIEKRTISPSGLIWLHGWAYDPGLESSDVAVGYRCDGVVSGGVTFLARPDVVAALQDPRARSCGFAMPIPLAVRDMPADFASNMLLADPAGQRSAAQSGKPVIR